MEKWHNATTQSLGHIYGTIMSLKIGGYGSLVVDTNTQAILGPIVEPISSFHRHKSLTDRGPWPASEPLGPHLALAVRGVEWLESTPGCHLFEQWRFEMHPKEDRSKTLPAFVELAETLVSIVSHMYSLFPLPDAACRPALFHPDFQQ